MKLNDIITEGRGVPQKPKPYGGSNPVAKNIEKFNRPVTHRDKKKELKKKGPEFNKHDYNSRDMDEGTYVAARTDIISNIVDKIRDKALDDDDLVRQLASLINMKAQPRGNAFRAQWQLDPIEESDLEEGEERSDIRDLMIPKIKEYLETKGPGSFISLEDLESDLYDYARQLTHDDLNSSRELRNFMSNPGDEASSAVSELLSGMYQAEFEDYITTEGLEEQDCWDGYKKDGTQKGTGKNKGKRVNKCVPKA
jgi:hypothetical protein